MGGAVEGPQLSRDLQFFKRVYALARRIPRGRVTTYGAIACALDAPNAARAVGWAMNGSGRVSPAVPAHRVVNREGVLTGARFFVGPDMMKALLQAEGVKVRGMRVVGFKNVFWDPTLRPTRRRA